MSTTFSVFVSSEIERTTLAEFLTKELKVSFLLESDDGRDLYSSEFCGLSLSIFDCTDFYSIDRYGELDQNIRFETFKADISVKHWAGERNANVVIEFARALACLIGSRLQWRLGIDNIVIEETQKIVATFSADPTFGRR